MKIIFLDIDGVLNGYSNLNVLGWKCICFFRSKRLKNWYRKIANPCGVHEIKVKRLARIVCITGAKVVMSSSWRHSWWNTPYKEMWGNLKKLADLFRKYDIEVIDITPESPEGKRDDEILDWLDAHEGEVENFIILDDENSFLRHFDDDERFIQTSSVPKGVLIMGRGYENTGLKWKHVEQAIRILGGK